ncbi:MAG: hypothetical protein HUJ93_09060, partial [Bacteroidales bacterium]|nr:hypothetical protein [Bacteroidales bacterium]
SSSNYGTISPNGQVSVNEGENVTFTFTPNESCTLVSVYVDDVDVTNQVVDNTYTFENVTADHTINANFEYITYTITASASANGNITPNGPVTVQIGESKTFTVTPNEGCQLVNVLVDDVDVTDQLVDNTYTFENVTADHTIVANFEPIPQTTYTITATAGANGTITPSGIVSLPEGSNMTSTITPNNGYQIASVLVDGVESMGQLVNNTYTFSNITADHTISASFAEQSAPSTYTIVAIANANGTISPSGQVSVNQGESVTFTITPNGGYRIASVTVDGVESMGQLVNSTYTFYNVTANHTIQASFEADGGSTPNTYTIIATAREHGTITPSGMVEVNENENQTFTFEAEEGYRIAAVIVDGVDVIDQVIDNSYTFYYVVANHTIEVSFVDANAVDMYSIGSIATYPNPNNGMFAIDFSNIEG